MNNQKGSEFHEDFTGFSKMGYHATSLAASNEIDINGIYPNKIFSKEEHNCVLSIAKDLQIPTHDYVEWLKMRSVTFTLDFNTVKAHITQGSAGGGQGLKNMHKVLLEISTKANDEQKNKAQFFLNKIDELRTSPPIIYAVDLSHLGQRIVDDTRQPLMHIYWQPECTLPPEEKLVETKHLISKLEFII